MQYYTLKAHPSLDSDVEVKERVVTKEEAKERGVFLRVLNSCWMVARWEWTWDLRLFLGC